MTRRNPGRPRPKPNATPDDIAFGINAVNMALRSGAARSVLVDEASVNARVRELADEARAQGLSVQAVNLFRLDELTGDGVHQGILARVRETEPRRLDRASLPAGQSLTVLLDGVTDPQNLGAILRTAVAVGIDAAILPKRRGAQLSPGVHRASAGVSFLAPVAAPQNLAQAVRELRELDYWVVAADSTEGSVDATTFDWPRRTALVLGSEGQGVSRLLLDLSDFRVVLPMDPRVESLNVGVAFGALAYLWRRQWPDVTRAGATCSS